MTDRKTRERREVPLPPKPYGTLSKEDAAKLNAAKSDDAGQGKQLKKEVKDNGSSD